MAAADLLYIADAADVNVYNFPNGTMYMLLRGLGGGMCVDRQGAVWITDYFGAKVDRVLHGGNRVVETLADPEPHPMGCAVDVVSSDVAVANYAGNNPGDPGSVTIFGPAVEPVRVLSITNMMFYFFCTYDDRGDLFVDGQDKHLNLIIAEKANGAAGFTTLTLVGLAKTFHYPGGIFWDGHAVAVGDYDRGIVYRLQISGSTATVVGSTRLTGANGLDGFAIVNYSKGPGMNSLIVAPNNGGNNAMMWSYPKGGNPIQTFASGYAPISAVISSAPTPTP